MAHRNNQNDPVDAEDDLYESSVHGEAKGHQMPPNRAPGAHGTNDPSLSPDSDNETTAAHTPPEEGVDTDLQRALSESMQTAPPTQDFEAEMEQALQASLREREELERQGEQDLRESLEASLREREELEEKAERELREQLELSTLQTCPICTKVMQRDLTTPCGHTFCQECLVRWLEWSDSCPICGLRCVENDDPQEGPSGWNSRR